MRNMRRARTKAPSAGRPGVDPARSNRLVMGRNCLRELLKHAPDRIVEVWVAAGPGGGTEKAVLVEAISNRGIPYHQLPAAELSSLVHSDSHQSFVVAVRERQQPSFREFVKELESLDSGLILALDSIMDPQNLGALLRVAECFGVSAVIWSKNRGTGLTPAVSKSSAGASELIAHYTVSNLVEALGKLKQAGFWIVVADASNQAARLDDLKLPGKIVLVLGSEGTGVRSLTSKLADFTVRIPQLGKISSLNVSQAGAVLLYHLQHSQLSPGTINHNR